MQRIIKTELQTCLLSFVVKRKTGDQKGLPKEVKAFGDFSLCTERIVHFPKNHCIFYMKCLKFYIQTLEGLLENQSCIDLEVNPQVEQYKENGYSNGICNIK